MKLDHHFPVGRYTCYMTWDHKEGSLSAMWEPETPRGLSKKEQAQYRKGRDALIKQIGKTLGISGILVVET